MNTKTISPRQTAVLASIMLFANKILVLPSLLYNFAKADSIFIIILILLAEMGVLFVFFRLKRNFPNMSFYQILATKLGVFVAKTFYFFILAYIFYKILLVYNVSYMYFRVQVYLDATFYLFVFVFLLVCNTSVFRGLRPIARCMEFFYFFIIACFVFCLLLSIANFNKFPIIFDTSIKNIFLGGFKHLFCFGDFIVLFLIMDKIELTKKGQWQIFRYVSFAMALIVVLYIMFYSIFNYTSFVHKNAVSDIITFSYRFTDLGRLDMVAIITVMFLSLFQISVGVYAFCECFKQLFPKLDLFYGVITFDLLFLSLILLSSLDYLQVINLGTLIVPYFAIVLQYVLPLICLLFTFGGRNEKDS